MRARIQTRSLFIGAIAAMFLMAGVLDASGQGRYTGRYSRGDVDTIIREMEDSADRFKNDFDNELNRSNLSNSQKRNYRNQVSSFENATDRLRSNFNSQRENWWQSRNEVQNVISNARPLNQTMNAIGFRRNIERQWTQLRNSVNRVADTYDLPGIAGGGWTGGPWNPGGNPGNPGSGGPSSNPPSWAVGTFYSTYPSITMTITNNGRVTVEMDGETYVGRFYNNLIYLNNNTSTITRSGNGFRTYNRNTGQTTNYTRRGGGGDGGYDDGNSGPFSSPPNWARGTFRAPNTGYVLTIAANGRVSANVGGQLYYGRYHNGLIYLNNNVSTVTRRGNGIQTYNRNTGETTNYVR